MSTIKVLGKYYAFSGENPKNGPKEGQFDSPDIVEEEKFEIFFPSDGCENKKEYVDIIRESGGIAEVEKSLYGKAGNDFRIFKFHENRRVVLNTKTQYDELIRNVKGEAGDPRVHIKLIPQKTVWSIKPGGSIELQRATVKEAEPSKESMNKSLRIDSTVKDLNGLFNSHDIENVRSYRLGDDIYIHCVCSKHIKARRERKKPESILREFKYEHYDKNHGSKNADDAKVEKVRTRIGKKMGEKEIPVSSNKSKINQPKINNFFKRHADRYSSDSSSTDESHKLLENIKVKLKKRPKPTISSSSSDDDEVGMEKTFTVSELEKDVPYDPAMALKNPYLKPRNTEEGETVVSEKSADPDDPPL